MTKILIDRAVVEQALGALECADGFLARIMGDDPGHYEWLNDDIAALRAALEEPQSTHSAACYQWHHKCAIAEVERLRAALEEPVQEPVAWRTFDGEGGYDFRTYEDNEDYAAEWAKRNPRYVGWVEPLYAAPPQRKPLTDEEIEIAYREIWRDLPTDFDRTSFGWIEQGIRYAERAHGIGEGE